MSDKQHMIEEIIDGLVKENESMGYKELVEKIEDLYNKNMHLPYEEYAVSMTKIKNVGWALVFNGKRPETKKETAKREAGELASKKLIDAEQLKLYLKLNKIYGKKKNCNCCNK